MSTDEKKVPDELADELQMVATLQKRVRSLVAGACYDADILSAVHFHLHHAEGGLRRAISEKRLRAALKLASPA